MTAPVPPHLSDEERAPMDAFDALLVDYACAIRAAMQVGDFPNMYQKALDADEAEARTAVYSAHSELLTALSTEREAGERAREDASGLRDALALVVDAWDTTGLGYQAKREAKRALAALVAIAADAESEIERLRALCAAPSTETPR